MVNDLIKGASLGVITFIWYYAGVAVPWVNQGSFTVAGVGGDYVIPDLGYLFFSFLAFALVCCKK